MLLSIKSEFDEVVVEVRGKGLMLGMELTQKAGEIMQAALDRGLIFNTAGGNTLRFLPPLIITGQMIDEAYDKLRQTFKILFS